MLTTYTTITPNFQLHIPVSIRKTIGLKKHGKAIIKADQGNIVIQPMKESPVLKLAGTLKAFKPLKKIDLDNIRDYIDYSRA